MKEILIGSLLCLFLIGGMSLSQDIVIVPHTPGEAQDAPGHPPWLIIVTDSLKYDPYHTQVLSNYKPIFRQLPSGQWEIRFVP